MNNAEIHAKIAEKVWPDCRYMEPLPEDTPVWIEDKLILYKWNGNRYVRANFNLLETDSNGEPTMQAKASAFDTAKWLRSVSGYGHASSVAVFSHAFTQPNPCQAIFNAAKSILDGEL